MKNLTNLKDKDNDIIEEYENSFIKVIIDMQKRLGETFEVNFSEIRDINRKINQDIEEIQNLIIKEEEIQKDLKERSNMISNVLNDFVNTMQTTIKNNSID